MKLVLTVSRDRAHSHKRSTVRPDGRPDFGSNGQNHGVGASLSAELELPDAVWNDPAAFKIETTKAYSLLEQIVETQVARHAESLPEDEYDQGPGNGVYVPDDDDDLADYRGRDRDPAPPPRRQEPYRGQNGYQDQGRNGNNGSGFGRGQYPAPRNGNGNGRSYQGGSGGRRDSRDPDAPRNAKQLIGWANKQDEGMFAEAQALGKSRGYSWKVLEWTPDQVADVYHELSQSASGRRWN